MFWNAVRAKKLWGLRVRRQVSIGPYIVDFYLPSARLVIELDGQPHFDARGREYDQARDRFLRDQGFEVLHVTDAAVRKNLETVIERIGQALLLSEEEPEEVLEKDGAE